MKDYRNLKKHIFSALACLLVSAIVLSATTALVHATETTYVVNLRERIISDLRGLQGVQEDTKKKQGHIRGELEQLQNDYASSLNETQRDRLRLEYRKKKAEFIETDAHNVIEGLKYVKNISQNIRLLNEEYMKEGKKDGLGLKKSDIALVQDTLIGFDQSLAVLKSFKPDDPEYALAEQALLTMDATYRERFTGEDMASLEHLIVYLQNVETYLESVKRFLQVNTRREKITVYKDVANEITDWLNNVFAVRGGNITDSYKRFREMDDMMAGGDRKLKVSGADGSAIGAGVIGRW